MTDANRERHRHLPLLLLAVAIYLPLLLTAPGRVGADTKTYLYLDPARLMSRAWSMWDPSIGLGTVSHQTIGYLWPMGPWYWAFEQLGAPDWVAQRLWLGTILFSAGAGVLWLLRSVLGWRTAPAAVAAFSYALTPYVLTLAARLSAILLPFAGLPWLLGLTVLAVRRGGWRYPALFALVVATVGSVNATALILAGLGPLWWMIHARLAGVATTRQLLGATARIGALTLAANLWWLAGLWAQSGWGIDILRYTETAEVVSSASNAIEVLRGFGYWFFYGGDRLGPWIEPGVAYTQRLRLLLVTFGLPAAALLTASRLRFRQRSFFVGLTAIGLVVSVGAYPWDTTSPFGGAVKAFLLSDAGLSMRSLPRAAPLVSLGLAACLGAGAEALDGWLRSRRDRRVAAVGPLVPAAAIAAVYLALAPLWQGQMVAENLDRGEDLPSYWLEVADHLDSRGHGTRVLELPGADFASYRWGNTVDPVTPGLIDRPFVARELIPYGTPAAAELVAALDVKIQEGSYEPGTLAAVARLMGVGDIVLRDDLQFERYRTPRPFVLSPLLADEPGLGPSLGFGEPTVNEPVPDVPLLDELAVARDDRAARPPVEVFAVDDPVPIIRTRPVGSGVVVAADANGLVDAAAAGVVDGRQLVRYGASLGREGVAAALAEGDALVITDGNRQQGRRWSTVRDNLGMVEPPAVLVDDDLTDNRLPVFVDAEDGWTTTAASGDVEVAATSYGNPITFTAEYRPANAFDGDPDTEWRTGAGTDVRGERLEIRAAGGTTASAIRFVQQISGFQNRYIGEIEIRRDGFPPQRAVLDERSRSLDGQVVELDPPSTDPVELVTIEIVADTSGFTPRWGRPVRWSSMTQVGFAEIELLDGARTAGLRTDPALRLPPAATEQIDDSTDLALVFTRWRNEPTDAVRHDPEPLMARLWDQPAGRTFELDVTARLSARAPDEILDQVFGVEGPVVTSSSRVVGDPTVRGSSALDGDPTTAWSPGFFDEDGTITVTAPAPVTISGLAPVLLDDDRFSVLTQLGVVVDGEHVASVDVPGDGSRVELPAPVTGTSFEFVVEAVDGRETIDWYGRIEVDVPVALAELGIPELAVTVPASIATPCRLDLLTIDGFPVPLRVSGTAADANGLVPLTVEPCEGGTLDLGAGEHRLETVNHLDGGIQIDQVVLRSGFGGAAGGTSGPGASTPSAPSATVAADDRWRVDVDITGATPGEPFWLVLGQSLSSGWQLDGAEPVLVDGFANGWVVEPTTADLRLELVWAPQRWVNRAIAVSVLAVVGCLLVIALGAIGRRSAAAAPDPALESSGVVDDVATVRSRPTPRPATARWRAAVVAGVAVGTAVFAGIPSGLAVGALTAVMAFGSPRVRRVMTVVPVAVYSVAVGYVISKQVWKSPGAAFEWPAEQYAAHQFALSSVALVVAILILQFRLVGGPDGDDPWRPAPGTRRGARHRPPTPSPDGAADADEVDADEASTHASSSAI